MATEFSSSLEAKLQKNKVDAQLARFFFAANIAFHKIEHAELKKLFQMILPGYVPPSEKILGGRLLNQIYEEEQLKCTENLKDQVVNLSIDGWSNIRNEPIICANVVKDSGEVVLVDTIDTSGKRHDAQYLTNLSRNIISKAESKYKCKIGSFVTDNAFNMAKMRKNIKDSNNEQEFIVTYGCSAHILNLLAQDLGKNYDNEQNQKHVIYVLKYFRNHHLPKAWYNEAGGKALSLPIEVRWNTISDSLESYINNYDVMKKVDFI